VRKQRICEVLIKELMGFQIAFIHRREVNVTCNPLNSQWNGSKKGCIKSIANQGYHLI